MMQSEFGKLYVRYFVLKLIADLTVKLEHFNEAHFPLERKRIEMLRDLSNIHDIPQFDEVVTAH